MRKKLILFIVADVLIATASAIAQQSQVPVPVEQRIATQIGSLVIQVATQAIQIEQLQASLAGAQARVKELEAAAKSEPPK